MAHLDPQVPEGKKHLFDQVDGDCGHAFFKQKKQIDIGMDALFLSTVAPQGNDGPGISGRTDFRADGAGGVLFTEIGIKNPGMLKDKIGRSFFGKRLNQCLSLFPEFLAPGLIIFFSSLCHL